MVKTKLKRKTQKSNKYISKKIFTNNYYENQSYFNLLIDKIIGKSYNLNKFNNIKENIKPFNISTGSGALIGTYKKYVAKIYSYSISEKDYSYYSNNKCYKLKRLLNELFINIVISNPYLFNKKIDKNYFKKEIKPYINSVEDIISNGNSICFLTNYLRVKDNILDVSYSNLYDIISNNHIPRLKELLQKYEYDNNKDNIKKLLNQYDDYFVNNILIPHTKILRFYQKYLNFLHTDMKLDNIFIKAYPEKKYNKMKKYDLLEKTKCQLNFIPILSDFDIARVEINKYKFIPKRNIKNIMLKLYKPATQIVDDIRFNCDIEYNKNKKTCKNIEIDINNIDLYAMIINFIFLLSNLNISFNLISIYFPQLLNYCKKEFNITLSQFEELVKYSYQNKGTRFTNINKTIIKLCNLV